MDRPPPDEPIHSRSWTGLDFGLRNGQSQSKTADRIKPETDGRTKRAIWILTLVGLALLMSDRIAPAIDGDRVLMECPDLTVWGCIGAFAAIFGRASGLFRIPPLIGKIAIGLATILGVVLIANLLLLTPLVQGSGCFQGGSWIAQVTRVAPGSADLTYRDGAVLTAGNADRHEHFDVKVGECVRVDDMQGRFGVRWVRLTPVQPRPGGMQPRWAHCFADDPLEEDAPSNTNLHPPGDIMQDLEDVVPAR